MNLKNLKKNNNLFIFTIATILLLSITACNETTGSSVKSSSENESALLKSYSKEGFITKNKFVTIIIIPENSISTESEINDKLKNRTLSSIQKHLIDKGKAITQNVKAGILNLISNYGKTKKFSDKSSKRFLYVLEIEKDNLKGFVESL